MRVGHRQAPNKKTAQHICVGLFSFVSGGVKDTGRANGSMKRIPGALCTREVEPGMATGRWLHGRKLPAYLSNEKYQGFFRLGLKVEFIPEAAPLSVVLTSTSQEQKLRALAFVPTLP